MPTLSSELANFIESVNALQGRERIGADSIVDVRNWGADATGTNDATTAIQAAANLGKSLFFPRGNYRMVGQVTLAAGQHVISNGAEITVDPAESYLGAFRAAGNNVKLKGLTFIGNGVETTVGAQAGLSQLGAAIRGYDIGFVDVSDCRFYGFELPNTDGASIIGFNRCDNISITNNEWGSENVGGQDINLSYRVGNAIVSNNRSISASDIFCMISSVGSSDVVPGTSLSVTSHHVIAHNVVIKNNGNVVPIGRHGILVHYNGGVSHAIIEGNILANGRRHGIYLRGANTVGENTGPSLVVNNIVRHFGGESGVVSSVNWGYDSGIKTESTDSLVVQGNLIENCGYNTDGTARTAEAGGIETIRATRNAIIKDNQVRNILGVGIALTPSVTPTVGTTSLERVAIAGNNVRQCTRGGIVVSTRAGSGTRPVLGVSVVDNMVETSAQDTAGIFINTTSLSGAGGESVIRGNTVIGLGANTGKVGIAFHPEANVAAYGVFDNALRGLDVGVGVYQSISSNGVLSVGYTGHRQIGSRITVDRNRFVDCGAAYTFLTTQTGRLSLVGPDNVYLGATPKPAANVNGFSRVIVGRVLGFDSDGVPLFVMSADAIPTASEQYYRGDRIINTVPTAGGTAGWICTASGTPGTWKTFGAIEA